MFGITIEDNVKMGHLDYINHEISLEKSLKTFLALLTSIPNTFIIRQ